MTAKNTKTDASALKATKAIATADPKPAKKAATAAKPKSKTVRVRALEAIAKGKDMTAAQVQAAIGLGHGLKPPLNEEVAKGTLSSKQVEGSRSTASRARDARRWRAAPWTRSAAATPYSNASP